MSKIEFLDQLRQSLNGRVVQRQVEDILKYYEDYIDSQMRSGKSEAEVMAPLGSPRLIARSIVDASGDSAEDFQSESWREERGRDYRGESQWEERRQGYQDESWQGRGQGYQDENWQGYGRSFDRWKKKDNPSKRASGRIKMPFAFRLYAMPDWVRGLIGLGIFIFILALFIVVLKFLLPIILLFVVAGFLVKLFRDWLN